MICEAAANRFSLELRARKFDVNLYYYSVPSLISVILNADYGSELVLLHKFTIYFLSTCAVPPHPGWVD